SCVDAKTNLAAVINANKQCDVSDQCVVAGATDCTCAQAVNRGSVPLVEEAAAAVDCCAFGTCESVDCAAPQNLRCELDRCTSD
ncbi:MAG TPA: hypothetical protein VGF99_13475, partial [Myxococcota bacterium]